MAKELKAMARLGAGKGAARAVRRQGQVPGVIYGDNKPPVSIAIDHVALRARLLSCVRRNRTRRIDSAFQGSKCFPHRTIVIMILIL